MTDNIPKICAAFEMWQNNDCIKAGTTLELIMRYLADDPEIDVVVSSADQDRAYRDYIGRQNENLNAKTMIIRELNTHVAQLKSEQTIDDECVGCCKQEELDECKERNDNRGMVIERLKEEIDSLDAALLDRDNIIVNLNKTIDDNGSDYEIMRTNHHNTVAKLEDDISSLEAELSTRKQNECKESPQVARITRSAERTRNATIDGLVRERDDLKQTLSAASVVIEKLEAEVAARKGDSEVLMKVVEIIKNWDDSTGRAFPTLIKILDELVDYTDAPEGPPETPIDDLYRVSVFLEMP